MQENIVVSIKNLKILFNTIDKKEVHAVNDVSFDIHAKETIAIVGESGSGKTQLVLAIMKLLAKNSVTSGEIIYNGQNILSLDETSLNQIRGNKISMIFQDPMTALNPYLKVSIQMTEILTDKLGFKFDEALEKSIEMLRTVSIPEPEVRINSYPHQFSGGMRQRIMIAMALLTNPELLIADEPTTALDVTIQAQILDILENLKKEMSIATLIVTHDLGVVGNIADKIAVFYAGKIVEFGTKDEIFNHAKHPYTQALLKSIPRFDQKREEKLFLIEGVPPVIHEEPSFCLFAPRCSYAMDICRGALPEITKVSENHIFSCFKYTKTEKDVKEVVK